MNMAPRSKVITFTREYKGAKRRLVRAASAKLGFIPILVLSLERDSLATALSKGLDLPGARDGRGPTRLSSLVSRASLERAGKRGWGVGRGRGVTQARHPNE